MAKPGETLGGIASSSRGRGIGTEAQSVPTKDENTPLASRTPLRIARTRSLPGLCKHQCAIAAPSGAAFAFRYMKIIGTSPKQISASRRNCST